MRAATPWRLALLLGCAGLAAAAVAQDAAARHRALAALAACRAQLDPVEDVGFARIAQRCPALPAALEAAGIATMLPADWRRARGELSAAGLDALRAALAAPPVVARRAAPDAATLERLWRGSRAAAAPPGAWQRFMRWLRDLVEGAAADGREAGRWDRWLQDRSPSARAWSLFGYLALLGLVAFLGWVLRAELQAAGWLGRARPVRLAAATTAAGAAGGGETRFESLALPDRPAWLLQRLARRLQASRGLPAPGALTARELAQAAQFELAADRATLRELGGVAERVRFGASVPTAAELEPATRAAWVLLQRLEADAIGRAGVAR